MKHVFIKFLAALGLLVGGAVPALAVAPAPALPSQCPAGVYNPMIFTSSKAIVGTPGNDYIVANDANSIDGMGGNDCIVAGKVNTIDGGAGTDVIVVSGWGNLIHSGVGNDKIFDNGGGSQLYGDAGNDYIKSTGNSSIDGGAGQDECYTGTNGSKVSCELPIAAPAPVTANWWDLIWPPGSY